MQVQPFAHRIRRRVHVESIAYVRIIEDLVFQLRIVEVAAEIELVQECPVGADVSHPARFGREHGAVVRQLVQERRAEEAREADVGLQVLDGREEKRRVVGVFVRRAVRRVAVARVPHPDAFVASAQLQGDVVVEVQRILREDAHRLPRDATFHAREAPARIAPRCRVVAVVAEGRAEDELVRETEDVRRVDPLGRDFIGIDLVVAVPVAVGARLHMAMRRGSGHFERVFVVDLGIERRVQPVCRAAVVVVLRGGLARVRVPLVARQATRGFVVAVVVERGDLQPRTVVPVLADAAVDVPDVEAGVLAVAVRVVVRGACPVEKALVLQSAAVGERAADGVPAAAVQFKGAVAVVVRRFGDDVDHARRSAVAVQDGLRTGQDFDLLDGSERDLREVGRVHVGTVQPLAVHEHEHAAESVFAVAAHGELGQGRVVAAQMVQLHRRREFGEYAGEVVGSRPGDILCGDDLHVLRQVPRRFVEARGLDDDGWQIRRD